MVCGNCGADVPDGNRYCPNCGEPIADSIIVTPARQPGAGLLAKILSVTLFIVLGVPLALFGACLLFLSGGSGWRPRLEVLPILGIGAVCLLAAYGLLVWVKRSFTSK
ncbi:MAG: zinc-ribbon domain-containing protein [Fimbriimonas sp.]|nr:zinc-ribbon domain-containing protein [Fimbriimonas sp.]